MKGSRRELIVRSTVGALATAGLAGLGSATAGITTSAPSRAEVPSIVRPLATAPVVAPAYASAAHTSAMGVAATPTSKYGYDLEAVGITPARLHIWVDKQAKHHTSLATVSRAAVKVLHAQEIRATYQGYGTPAQTEGVVTIGESAKGCANGATGITWPRQRYLPNRTTYIISAHIYICPKTWTHGSWVPRAVIGHEIGHAAGLGHFNGTYRDQRQLLWQTHYRDTSYRAGDLNGLKALAKNNSYVKSSIAPIGHFDSTARVDHSHISLTGWAVPPWYPGTRANIVVTEDGKRVAVTTTTVLRSDVNAAHDRTSTTRKHGFRVEVPITPGVHKFSVSAVSPVRSTARTDLGWTTWTWHS